MQPIDKWMKKNVHVVRPLDSIEHARVLMQKHRINQLPVTEKGRLVGIITDRDLRDAYPSVFEEAAHDMANEADDFRPEDIYVESVMTGTVSTLGTAATLADAARIMRQERVGAVPVVDDGGALVGLITRSDILDAYVDLDKAS